MSVRTCQKWRALQQPLTIVIKFSILFIFRGPDWASGRLWCIQSFHYVISYKETKFQWFHNIISYKETKFQLFHYIISFKEIKFQSFHYIISYKETKFQSFHYIISYKETRFQTAENVIVLTFFGNIYNPGENIWNKLEKSSIIGQGKESLISTFAHFLTAIAKV